MQAIDCQQRNLGEATWRRAEAEHRERMSLLLRGHEDRASRGERHPVEDFLFTYYAFRPSALKRWHPGIGVVLAGDGAREFLDRKFYATAEGGVTVDPLKYPAERREGVTWIHSLLRATESRPAAFGCFGLHEWAMVYRQTSEEIRHSAWPLRMTPGEIAGVVEAGPVRCTHFDAFRFFTAQARPLNRVQPERATIHAFEQRGCLHANMDLYKWAAKLLPFAPSGLVADAFELARDIREVDMRASPYDFRTLGYTPIAIETSEGRVEYEAFQRAFAERGVPIRARLIAVCEEMIDAWISGRGSAKVEHGQVDCATTHEAARST